MSRPSGTSVRWARRGAAADDRVGEDAYPDVWTKAAALLQSIVKNHPLVDGNKRLGWLATAVFLDLNDVPIVYATSDDVDNFVISGHLGDGREGHRRQHREGLTGCSEFAVGRLRAFRVAGLG